MKTTFKKGNLYINKNGLIVKCTKNSKQGSYDFEGVVIHQGSDGYPVGTHDYFWNIRVFTLHQEEKIQEPEINVIL